MENDRKILYLRISEEKVHMVRCMHECGLGYKAIAKLTQIPKNTVRDLVLFRRRPYAFRRQGVQAKGNTD